MSKRALKKYLSELRKPELEEQLLDLYDRFPAVKTYYNFVFNPKEDKLVQQAKFKISNEYFPVKRRRPKARRSVAHKFIKQFITLGVDPLLIADVMLYNLEIAQSFSKERKVYDAFYKSMLKSFTEAVHFVALNALLPTFKDRIVGIYKEALKQQWPHEEGFSRALDNID